MLWVISYDVPSDRTRGQVAEVLSEYGVRVQWSVFECRVEEEGLAAIRRRLGGVLAGAAAGSVRGYRVCGTCAGVGWVLGEERDEAPGASAFVVI